MTSAFWFTQNDHDPDVSMQYICVTLSIILGGRQRLNIHQDLPDISLPPPNKHGGLRLCKSLEEMCWESRLCQKINMA